MLNFVWDDENLLLQKDERQVTQRQYTQYPGYWGGVFAHREGTGSLFPSFDHQGNLRY